MLRPSRPMMRPFSSSDLSSTTDTVVSTAWLDATRCITVARMLRARRSASRRVSSSTWRISRALSWRSSSSSSRIMICFAWPALRPDEPLQLAQLVALGVLQLLARVVEVALAVVERALALGELLRLQLDRALLGAQALLEPGELRAAHLAARPRARRCARRARRRGGAARSAALGRGRALPLAGCAARGRCSSSATDTATAAATSAANTISIRCLPLSRRSARRPRRFRAAQLGAARHQYVLQKRRARQVRRARVSSTDPPERSLRVGRGVVIRPHEKKVICWCFGLTAA